MEKNEKFLAAIKDHEGLLLKIASVYTNNAEDKNDLVQEIIYQIWKSFDSFHQKSSLGTWMYRVALNVAVYQLKVSKRKTATVPLEEHILNYPDDDNSEVEHKWEIFRQQVENFNLLDKAIIMLHLDNKSYDEIGEIIGISSTNVGTKLHRIKEKLKLQISKHV